MAIPNQPQTLKGIFWIPGTTGYAQWKGKTKLYVNIYIYYCQCSPQGLPCYENSPPRYENTHHAIDSPLLLTHFLIVHGSFFQEKAEGSHVEIDIGSG
jgi:hypothetical protein